MPAIRQESLLKSVYWTLHAWWYSYSIPTDAKFWTRFSDHEPEELRKRSRECIGAWNALVPFFLSHGYYLYESPSLIESYPRRCQPAIERTTEVYPYARHVYQKDKEIVFPYVMKHRLWAARDNMGRDVIIKAVSFSGEESPELQVYHRLNTPEARRDPRNHTLPVLDFISYNGISFVVTPRWGMSVPGPRVYRAEQLLHMADVFLEGLVFLHENRIAHCDIAAENTVINAIYGLTGNACQIPELRNAPEVRYAFIDFEVSTILPMETDIRTVSLERNMRIGHINANFGPGLSNPFSDDVVILVNFLQDWVRVIESAVPEVGIFFDEILSEKDNPPSALTVLCRLRSIRKGLTQEKLDFAPVGRFWRDGNITQTYEDIDRFNNR